MLRGCILRLAAFAILRQDARMHPHAARSDVASIGAASEPQQRRSQEEIEPEKSKPVPIHSTGI